MPVKPRALNNTGIKIEDFSENIFELGKIDGSQVAFPILRVPPLVSINLDILEKYGRSTAEITSPVDLLKLGFELEKAAGKDSSFIGSRYYGALFHGALYGVEFKHIGSDIKFDENNFSRFLEETKPYIKRQHFIPHNESGIDKFTSGKYCIYPHFSTDLLNISSVGIKLANLKLPLLKDAFVCEGIFMAAVDPETRNSEEAELLLEFFLSEEAQKTFIEKLPYCLSVRNDVLSMQKISNSPALNSCYMDFDLRSFYTQMDLVIFNDYAKKLNTETGKYFLGIQELKTTIDKLKSFEGAN